MRKLLTALVSVLMVIPISVYANSVGTDIGVDIETENFEPLVWMCEDRVVYDDATEPGRISNISNDGEELVERTSNYAFEGEQIQWNVLVMDKNGIQKVSEVFATVGPADQGAGNPIEVNCVENPGFSSVVEPSCNARILEEDLSGEEIDSATQRYYECTLTVEPFESMYDEHWITVEAEDIDGLSGTMDENEYWFLNPIIDLFVDGSLVFENVRPGTASYSNTLLVGNDADDGSGVHLDMFISGTDFYDSSSSGAACPTTNQLALTNFRYFVTLGAYDSYDDAGVDSAGTVVRGNDAEGYTNIDYGIGWNDPTPFYDDKEILQAAPVGPYWTANILSPGAEMALTFKLSLPEPCNGDFDSGSLFFWGEAV